MFSRILMVEWDLLCGLIAIRSSSAQRSHDEKSVVVATAMLPIRVGRLAGRRYLRVDPLVSG
jgi:hypothetical protein